MERITKVPLLCLGLALFYVCAASEENHTGLICYTDYNRTITCTWKNTNVSDYADSACTIHAKRLRDGEFTVMYSGSCNLEPVDAFQPTIKRCSIGFDRNRIFKSFDELNISMKCSPVKPSLSFLYKPICHIKLNPPPKPIINSTRVSWLPQENPKSRINHFRSEIQWREENHLWSKWQQKSPQCSKNCEAQMEGLIRDGRYEARVRVMPVNQHCYDENLSTWSDWSPVTSWVSLVGRSRLTPTPTTTPQPLPQKDTLGRFLGFAAVMVVIPFLIVLFYRDKTTWIVEKIRGPPLPNPAKSFLQDANFKNLMSPHFTCESLHPFLRPVEIVHQEMTFSVDAVAPSMRDAEKIRLEGSDGLSSSGFSNPSYSRVSSSPPPPVSSLTAGNLQPCAEDSPYGPVCRQDEDKNPDQDGNEARGTEKILQLFSKNNSKPMAVISDYEKVEKSQVERTRLRSLDSGMCEEVSQESLEADSTEGTDECAEKEEEKEEGNVDFKKLFKGTFDKGSIQVCSDYKQIQRQQSDSSELPSLDAGISSEGEEQVSQEEILEGVDVSTKSTRILFPSSCSLPFFTPLNMHGAGPPLPGHVLESIAVVPTNSVEPSSDGYMPVRQEQY